MKITKWRIVSMPDNIYVVEEEVWKDNPPSCVWSWAAQFSNFDDANHYTLRYPRIVKHN